MHFEELGPLPIKRKNLNEIVEFLSLKYAMKKSRSIFICKNLIWIRNAHSVIVFTRNVLDSTKNKVLSSDYKNDFDIDTTYQELLRLKNLLKQSADDSELNYWSPFMTQHLFDYNIFDYNSDCVKIDSSFVLNNPLFNSVEINLSYKDCLKKTDDLIASGLSQCNITEKCKNFSFLKDAKKVVKFLMLDLFISIVLKDFFTASDVSYIKEKFFANSSFLRGLVFYMEEDA
jgi:hypothetical protein